MPLFIIFVVIPLLEIAVFIQVGQAIGVGTTLLLTFLTAVIGATLLRWQGLETWARVNESLGRNELPLQEVFDGVCLLIAGATLLTPGFVTDTVGFLLFIPPLRVALFAQLKRMHKQGKFRANMHYARYDMHRPGHPGQDTDHGPTVIDAEYTTIEEVDAETTTDKDGDTGSHRR